VRKRYPGIAVRQTLMWRIRRLVPTAAAVLVLGLIWLVPTASVSTTAPNSSPTPGKVANPQRIDYCKPGMSGVRFGTDRNDVLKDWDTLGEIICAGAGDDTIVARYLGTIVFAGQGDDNVNTRQKQPGIANNIQGGDGNDTAIIDKSDNAKGVESVRSMSTSSINRVGSSTDRVGKNAWEYPAVQPRIQCVIVDGERRLLFDPTPEIRAVDSTAQVDWQSVAWSPVLTLWNAQSQRWDFVVQNEWLWDRTYDEQITTFKGNRWRSYKPGSEPWSLWFYAFRPQTFYRVAVYYYHYAEGNVPAHRIYTWVDQYAGEFAAPDGKSCFFPR